MDMGKWPVFYLFALLPILVQLYRKRVLGLKRLFPLMRDFLEKKGAGIVFILIFPYFLLKGLVFYFPSAATEGGGLWNLFFNSLLLVSYMILLSLYSGHQLFANQKVGQGAKNGTLDHED